MNIIDLDAIQSVRTYPCISVLLTTQPATSMVAADRDRLDGLLADATRRLRAELDADHAAQLEHRLRRLADGVAGQPQQRALALFVNDELEWVDRLVVAVSDRVVIDDTFATRDLVEHLNRTDPYWVVALSEHAARLFLGNIDRLVELDDGDFPLVVTREGGVDAQTPDEFLRRVARTLDVELDDDDVALVLVGVERTVSLFQKFSGREPLGRVLGNHDRTPTRDLHDLTWPVMARMLDARQSLALGELDRARSRKRFASGLGELWSLAHDGRVALVVAERTFQAPVRLGSTPDEVVPADDREHPDVIDDLVDDLVEVVLTRGGRAVFVDDGVLNGAGRVAAVLRY